MCRLFSLTTLLFAYVYGARSPKIYNVLISTNKNLSPSQAVPVYEPVIRTASVGYAFPSFIYQTSYQQYQPINDIQPAVIQTYPVLHNADVISNQNGRGKSLTDDATTAPFPVERYIDYSQFPNRGYIQQEYLNKSPRKEYEAEENQPNSKKEPEPNHALIPANFKKNPEIPDVFPPLPVKSQPGT